MELFSFFNSSASYRVRIALALKGAAAGYHAVNIRGGEHRAQEYVSQINPSASVPALEDGGFRLGQSLAIIDWLDSRYPTPRLIPDAPALRARVLELSYLIACDIHPINNLRVLGYLQHQLGLSPEPKNAWYRHWIADGMAAVERLLVRAEQDFGGPWCCGAAPTMADCCLIPQIANALRFDCDLSGYPRAKSVYAFAMAHPAFAQAAPGKQPDHVAH